MAFLHTVLYVVDVREEKRPYALYAYVLHVIVAKGINDLNNNNKKTKTNILYSM